MGIFCLNVKIMFKLLNVAIFTLLFLICTSDISRPKNNSLVYINNKEVLIPMGDETVLLNNSRSCLPKDSTLILDGKMLKVKTDRDTDAIEFLQNYVLDSQDNVEVVGVISLEDAKKFKVTVDTTRNKLMTASNNK